jgi:hypothetical protein
MSTQPTAKKNIFIIVKTSEDERDAYHALAKAEKRSLSEMIRTALAERAAAVKRP